VDTGNGPRMSIPHYANDHGEVVVFIYTDDYRENEANL
jgi:hypothetical protein